MNDLKKTAVYLLIVLLLVNLVVFALKLISTILFWVIIAAIGVVAYKDVIKKHL